MLDNIIANADLEKEVEDALVKACSHVLEEATC
jgi:hypothetical protein